MEAERSWRLCRYRSTSKKGDPLVRAKVYVTPKPGVLDPAGKAIESALHSLGFAETHDVRLGKYIEMRIDGNAEQVNGRLDDMCRKLLANGVIEDYRFEIGD
jgi:phosphoribosylformylglycinamidine synthase